MPMPDGFDRDTGHLPAVSWRLALTASVFVVGWAVIVVTFGIAAASLVSPVDAINANSRAVTMMPVRLAYAVTHMDQNAAVAAFARVNWSAPTTWVVVTALAPATALGAVWPFVVLDLPGVSGGVEHGE
jgi:hypothetical protein